MKLLDANAIVGYFAVPVTANDVLFQQLTANILDSARLGTEKFTTTTEVIAEVVYVLQSDRHKVSRGDISDMLSLLLTLPGCEVPERQLTLDALNLWRSAPNLSFVDARLVCVARARSLRLVSFDTALARAAGVQRWDRQVLGGAQGMT